MKRYPEFKTSAEMETLNHIRQTQPAEYAKFPPASKISLAHYMDHKEHDIRERLEAESKQANPTEAETARSKQIEELKERAKGVETPFELLVIGNEISRLEAQK